MTERVKESAEKEARDAAIDIYRTLGVPRADTGPDAKIWLDLLVKTRNRFEKFRYKPMGYARLLFVPQIYQKDHEEQIYFISQIHSAGYQPTIEWRVLQRKTSETKELFTVILSLKRGEPNIALMQETLSIFRIRDLRIDNLMSKWIPKMASQTAVIRRAEDAYFAKEELGQKVEGGYMPVEEALQRFDYDRRFST